MPLINHLAQESPVILDGALGTELQRRQIPTNLPLWSAAVLFNQPEKVVDIHADYIRAGAEINITNTFRTARRTLIKAGLENRTEEINHLAVDIVRQAVDQVKPRHKVFIAGSVAPLEDCYYPKLAPNKETAAKEHQEQIKYLVDAGVDIIILETFGTLPEAEGALQAAKTAAPDLPVAISLITKENKLLDQTTLKTAVETLDPYQPDIFGVNCVPLAEATSSLKILGQLTSKPLLVYAHGDGLPDPELGWKFTQKDFATKYAEEAKAWAGLGAKIIGGCCGTTPEYIAQLAKAL